ncbi:hypothetical protein PF66_06161 [Pseudomonas asplenii]|uniref:Uncharacterized protein n=1 Tax=Pseudomonas asplenii TaxID=53407 RepID=A0A0N0E168_9PSED|nr:hypothetical protein PF66_06161 [Pseudomonas fuscovaginae]
MKHFLAELLYHVLITLLGEMLTRLAEWLSAVPWL